MTAAFELERFEWTDGAFEVAGHWEDGPPPRGRVRLVVEVDGRRRRLSAQRGRVAAEGAWQAGFTCTKRPDAVGPAALEVGGELAIDLPRAVVAPEPPPDVRAAEALLATLRGEREALEAAAQRLRTEREAAEAATERLAGERAKAEAAHEAEDKAAWAAAAEAAELAAGKAREAAAEVAERTARDTAAEVAEQTAREAAERAMGDVADRAAREAVERVRAAAPTPAAPPPTRPIEPVAPPPVTPRRAAIRESLELPREPRSVLVDAERRSQRWLAYALALLIVILIAALVVLLL